MEKTALQTDLGTLPEQALLEFSTQGLSVCRQGCRKARASAAAMTAAKASARSCGSSRPANATPQQRFHLDTKTTRTKVYRQLFGGTNSFAL